MKIEIPEALNELLDKYAFYDDIDEQYYFKKLNYAERIADALLMLRDQEEIKQVANGGASIKADRSLENV